MIRNKKVIVLSGFARGGTNIAWNLLQSHPAICSPPYETGELFRKSWILAFCRYFSGPTNSCKRLIDNQLFNHKLATLKDPDNRFVTEGRIYARQQVADAALCLKSVNDDIFLTDLLLQIYPNLYFVALTRNGYALADGYIRRGKTAVEAGRLYCRISKKIKRYSETISRFKMIRFEDILQAPFDVAKELYEFTDVCPRQLEKIRLKSKRFMSEEGAYSVVLGEEGKKLWFDRSNINKLLYPGVNEAQAGRLSNEMIKQFDREAAPALDFFGYEKFVR